MNALERPHILCVDDEVELLRGLMLHLGKRYQVRTATSGAAGLELLRENSQVDVIISDMRMPGLSGAEFLARSRSLAPEAQRILLTGQTDLASAIAAVNEGQVFRFLTKPCPPPELLGAVEAALVLGRTRTLERSAVRRRVEQHQLQFDPLTGLASQQHVMAVLEAGAYDASESVSAPVAYCIDIDGSDEPIHPRDRPWGDELAGIIADRLRQHCNDAAVVARWGVEQFVVLVQSRDESDNDLCARGEKLLNVLSEPIALDRDRVAVGVSIGIARQTDRMEWQRLIQRASSAARAARGAEGIKVYLYQPEVPPQAETQRELLHALREALDQESLHLNYQPIVDVKSGCVHSIECLARWHHRTLGEIVPSTFIPLSEQSGDIIRLGQLVLWRACHEARSLFNHSQQRLAVNVSVKQLLDKGFLPYLEKCLAHSGLPPQTLELEITESALAFDLKKVQGVLEQVRKLKVCIAVDDFGTGYSSLAYLSTLPIDLIKVDRAFVRDFHQGGKTIIKAALAIAHDFGLEVIIEGIESADMLLQVRKLGAALIQGYWFAKPMDADRLVEWLRDYESSSSSGPNIVEFRALARE